MLTFEEDVEIFKPNEGTQQEFFDDYTHRYIAYAGGWNSGKTWAGARKLANLHAYNGFNDAGQPTYVKGLIVAPTYAIARTVNIPEMMMAFSEMGVTARFVPDPKRYCFEVTDFGTKNRPSEILVRSADAPEAITGFAVGHAWGDEAARWPVDEEDPLKNPIIQSDGRLRDPAAKFQQMLFTYTNEGDDTEVFNIFEKRESVDHKLYRGSTFENPHAITFANNMMKQLSPELAAQYIGGSAISLRGNRMYNMFNAALHAQDNTLSLKFDLPVQVAIDYNSVPGMNAVMGQYDKEKDLFTAVHGIHERGMLIPQMVQAIHEILFKYTQDGTWKWPDALHVFDDAISGRESNASRGETYRDVVAEYLSKYGIPFRFRVASRNPFITDRVNAMNSAFMDARGNNHCQVHPDCFNLINDLKHQRWNKDGDPDKKDKKRSHQSDAYGYLVHYQRPIRPPKMTGGRIGSVSQSAR